MDFDVEIIWPAQFCPTHLFADNSKLQLETCILLQALTAVICSLQ